MDPEVAEFGRTFQRFMERMSEAAGAGEPSALRRALDEHLGADASTLPIVADSFMAWDHVNVQVALDAFLAGEGRSHELLGLSGQQRHHETFSDLVHASRWAGATSLGSVDHVNLPISPDATRACVAFGLYLIDDGGTRTALLVRAPQPRFGLESSSIEILCPDGAVGHALLGEIRRLMAELNVFRGQVLSLAESQMGYESLGPIVFHRRPRLSRDQLVLHEEALSAIELEVIGIAEQRDRLRASGQHVKRGILLWGPPGSGKTHTVRYLLSRLREHTVLLLTGGGLRFVRHACGLARLLQPSVVVLEDVDLVAERREVMGYDGNPLLFDVLNEIDGMAEDVDVAFLLTTNRADLLEPALAARPGRVDLAVEIPLPDEASRVRLIELYGRGLDLRLEDRDAVVARTAGVTGSFIKELMRKAALVAAVSGDGGGRIAVTDEHLVTALDEMLDERSALTRTLLGAEPRTGGPPASATAWLGDG